jgi:hypothetical protein
MKTALRTLVAAIVLCALPLWGANDQQLRLHWNELAAYVDDAKVVVYLRDGKRLKGVITEVQEEALLLQSGDTIPRNSVTQIRAHKLASKGRFLGTALGGTIAALAGLAGAAGTGRGIASMVVLAGGGYATGYGHDRHELLITVLP